MVKPMASPPSPDDALKLVGLHPDHLIHPLITPQTQALSTQFHCSSCHPQKDITCELLSYNDTEKLINDYCFKLDFVRATTNNYKKCQ